jgi:toxin ParE1/3/4
MNLVITDAARADLVRIADWIARDNPRRAISFIDELEAICRQIPAAPRSHALVPAWEGRGIRRAVHGNYLIFYRVDHDQIVVIHILHGARDYDAVFFPDG